MGKKIGIIIGILVLIIFLGAYFIIPNYALGLVTDYSPYTFERVLQDDTMKVNYGIYDNTSPASYGFEDFREVTYPSILDGNQLSAWYVPATKASKKTMVLIHGRWSNRLKTMKYLELIKVGGLDTLCNVIIPDMRNSGRSELAPTMMGYEFSEDIASTLHWLSKEEQQSEVILYGFSMGAMAVATLFNRPELIAQIEDDNITTSGIILDSPVAHVIKILRRGGSRTGLPDFILDRTLYLLNEEYDGFPEKMSFSHLLKDIPQPILILQGTDDQSQPTAILEEEYRLLDRPNIDLIKFEGAEHVRIYQEAQHKKRYTNTVLTFVSEL